MGSDIVAKGRLAGDQEVGGEGAAGVLPGPRGANMNSDVAGFGVEDIALAGGFSFDCQGTIGRIGDRK